METKKAKFLNKYLLTSIQVFNDVIHQEPLADYEIEGELLNFEVSDFEIHYNDFLKELEVVILETNDISIAHDYLETCFHDIIYWSGFQTDQNKIIFSIGYEVNFLIKLKQNIEKYYNIVKGLCEIDYDEFPEGLVDIYNSTINSKQLQNESNTSELKSTEYTPDLDNRFVYEKMLVECDKLKSYQEKILFIHDRVYHLKQWELLYDINDGYSYRFSPIYYPNFENLCKMELFRLEKRFELEKKMNSEMIRTDSIDNTITNYQWNASDTDLLELTTSLLKSQSITRQDGKKMTHKELKEAFERMFGHEIKDAKSKLATAVNRKKSVSPFLDSLKAAFEVYSRERDENKPVQKKTG